MTTWLAPLAITGSLLVLLLAVPPLNAATGASDEPETYRFDIMRNGKKVGTHSINLSRGPDRTRVKAESRIDVRVLGIPAYRLRYAAEELWDDRGLVELDVSVDDNGRTLELEGERRGDLFAWQTDNGVNGSEPLPVYPTNHWNEAVLDADTVLNTLTGKLNRVDIAAAGRDAVTTPERPVTAERYRYGGELELESWYADNGTWLGMQFAAKDGSQIRYVCRNCVN